MKKVTKHIPRLVYLQNKSLPTVFEKFNYSFFSFLFFPCVFIYSSKHWFKFPIYRKKKV